MLSKSKGKTVQNELNPTTSTGSSSKLQVNSEHYSSNIVGIGSYDMDEGSYIETADTAFRERYIRRFMRAGEFLVAHFHRLFDLTAAVH